MFNKEFIKNKGKIKQCNSNIAKMSILENIICKIFVWKSIQYNIKYCYKECFESLIEGFRSIIDIVINTILIIFFPITLILTAYLDIKHAQKEVDCEIKTIRGDQI